LKVSEVLLSCKVTREGEVLPRDWRADHSANGFHLCLEPLAWVILILFKLRVLFLIYENSCNDNIEIKKGHGMIKKPHPEKKYSKVDLEKIRTRAREIWKRKCQSLNTALDDWLQAERDLRKQLGIEHKSSADYTAEEVRQIKERAEAVRQEKIGTLRTAFNDWIEAEQELKAELKKRINVNGLFDLWFGEASSRVTLILKTNPVASSIAIDEILGQQYVELMAKCMT